MATIYVDGVPYEVDPDDNLLHACLSLGMNIPYFCWHPAMGSVGACRQCAVKQYRDETDTQGRIVMACMTPSAEGTRISINEAEAAAFREQIIEYLMINHPHDCPICDEGGECHLQDMTLMTGHAYRRYRFNKRTYRNQYLGPFINHEMNRCIQCYRCTRFYRDYAGGHDLDVFGAHDKIYFGRSTDGVLENEFSGNLVEVCPTGVFTDKTLKQHYTRKWDLQTAPSVCVHCSVGCNTIPGERYGELRRILNGYNREVNGYFLCDRGRFGYGFVNHERRIRQPRLRAAESQVSVPISRTEALQRVGEVVAQGRVIGIGSPRAALEANFALRTLVGPENFYAGFSAGEGRLVQTAIRILQDGPARSASLHEMELSDAVFVLGEDLTNTAPMMALAVRQAVRRKPMEIPRELNIPLWNDYAVRDAIQDQRGPLYIAAPARTKLDEVATHTYQAAPADLARLGYAVAGALHPGAPQAEGLPEELRALADEIGRALLTAERPLVIAGTSLRSEALLQAAANVAWALRAAGRPASLSLVVPECNSLGLGLMGGKDLPAAWEALQNGQAETVIVLENDLYRRAEADLVEAQLAKAGRVIVIDHLENATSARAEITLPAATFAEGDGTLVNNEGRAQRFFQVFTPEGEIQESWRWLRDIMDAAGRAEAGEWHNLDAILAAMAEQMPVFAPALESRPLAGYRLVQQRIPRKPHRYSGRTAMLAHRTIHEPKPPDDPDTPMAFSMEGYKGRPPGALLPRYWAPAWNSVQALNKFQDEVAGPLHAGDPGRRLIEPAQGGGAPAYFDQAPEAFRRPEGEWLVVPLYHIYGSEELSVLSPAVAELVPEPYLAVNPAEAEGLGAAEGDPLEVSIDGGLSLTLPLRAEPALPAGVAGLPAGLPGLPGYPAALPAWARLRISGGKESG